MESKTRGATDPTEQHATYSDHAPGTVSRHGFMHVCATVSRFDVYQHIHATTAGVWVAVKTDDPEADRALAALTDRYEVDHIEVRTDDGEPKTYNVRLSGGWE